MLTFIRVGIGIRGEGVLLGEDDAFSGGSNDGLLVVSGDGEVDIEKIADLETGAGGVGVCEGEDVVTQFLGCGVEGELLIACNAVLDVSYIIEMK